MLCVSVSKYNFYAVRLYQQVWLLCCAVSVSKCDFYAVSSPSASVTSVVSSSSSNVTSILCRLHQQVWLLCRFVCVSWRDFYAVPCSSASVTCMPFRLRQQTWLLCSARVRQQVCLLCCAVFVSKPSCQMCEDAVKLTWLFNIPEQEKQNQKKKNVRLWEQM